MDSGQVTRMQQACHVKFKELQKDGAIPDGLTAYAYAEELVGRPIASLKQLADWELLALRDRLEGKPNKILERVYATARAIGIGDLDAWLKSLAAQSKTFDWLRGMTAPTLPLGKQWRLLKMLETRRSERTA